MTRKAGLFDPYLDTLGGGERYLMTIAECLLEREWDVDVFWGKPQIKKNIEERFNLNLNGLNFVENIFRPGLNILQKRNFGQKYDLIIYLSDGSLPSLFAKKNILHFQVPFTGVNGRSFPNKIKMAAIHHVVCNSNFTKRFIDKEFDVKSSVLYPPVAIEDFSPAKKENIILNVSRFSRAMQAKKQEVLINAFRAVLKEVGGKWRLILAGGLRNEDSQYFAQLKEKAAGLPVEFLANLSFEGLKQVYGKAKIFWHAAGYGEDEENHPEKMEHFGIVIAEAMAAGCVPVVIRKGGIPEIVADRENGLLWETRKQLEDLTIELIKSPKLIEKYSSRTAESVEKFSQENFCRKLYEIVEN